MCLDGAHRAALADLMAWVMDGRWFRSRAAYAVYKAIGAFELRQMSSAQLDRAFDDHFSKLNFARLHDIPEPPAPAGPAIEHKTDHVSTEEGKRRLAEIRSKMFGGGA